MKNESFAKVVYHLTEELKEKQLKKSERESSKEEALKRQAEIIKAKVEIQRDQEEILIKQQFDKKLQKALIKHIKNHAHKIFNSEGNINEIEMQVPVHYNVNIKKVPQSSNPYLKNISSGGVFTERVLRNHFEKQTISASVETKPNIFYYKQHHALSENLNLRFFQMNVRSLTNKIRDLLVLTHESHQVRVNVYLTKYYLESIIKNGKDVFEMDTLKKIASKNSPQERKAPII